MFYKHYFVTIPQFGWICNPAVLGIRICNPTRQRTICLYRITNADIQGVRIANPNEQAILTPARNMNSDVF